MEIKKNTDDVVPDTLNKSGTGVHQDSDIYIQIKELLGIPFDEPIFILRAQDKFSIKTIKNYRNLVRDNVKVRPKLYDDWQVNISSIIGSFVRWQQNNKDKVKVPD